MSILCHFLQGSLYFPFSRSVIEYDFVGVSRFMAFQGIGLLEGLISVTRGEGVTYLHQVNVRGKLMGHIDELTV